MADRFISPCPPPTAYQREVAEILIEECAEVIQRATKMLRFGVDEAQPGQPYTNRDRLSFEVGDLIETVALGIRAGILDEGAIESGRASKRARLLVYMQTAPDDDGAPVLAPPSPTEAEHG